MKVLVIDDSPEVTEAVALCFELRWPHSTIVSALTGNKGVDLVEAESPDIVILDIGLPDIDGFEACRQIRSFSETPIIMLTVRDRDVDVARGLELGADDYIPKPFSPRIVVARVRALLRRSEAASVVTQVLRVANLEIDLEGHTVQRDGQPLELTPTEFSLLVTLASQPGRAFSRLLLLEASQGSAYEGYERTIDAHIKNLRAKIEPDPKNPQYIETVFGVGYRFTRS